MYLWYRFTDFKNVTSYLIISYFAAELDSSCSIDLFLRYLLFDRWDLGVPVLSNICQSVISSSLPDVITSITGKDFSLLTLCFRKAHNNNST